jgi:hypothetical protein
LITPLSTGKGELMLKKWLSLMLVSALTLTLAFNGSAAVSAKTAKEAKQAEKIKAGIAKLGVGRDARVKLKLKDQTKLSGFISEARAESFVVTDLETGASTRVAYPDVAQVQGHNLSKGAKIAIAVGIVAGVILVLYIVRGAFCDGC